jgi:hypothetical protein
VPVLVITPAGNPPPGGRGGGVVGVDGGFFTGFFGGAAGSDGVAGDDGVAGKLGVVCDGDGVLPPPPPTPPAAVVDGAPAPVDRGAVELTQPVLTSTAVASAVTTIEGRGT